MALFRNEISSNEKGEITTTALRRPSFEYTRIITSASQSSSSLVLLLRCFSKDVPYFFIHSSLSFSLFLVPSYRPGWNTRWKWWKTRRINVWQSSSVLTGCWPYAYNILLLLLFSRQMNIVRLFFFFCVSFSFPLPSSRPRAVTSTPRDDDDVC